MSLTSEGSNGSFIPTLAVAGVIVLAGLALGWITRPQHAENSVVVPQAPPKELDESSPLYMADKGYQSCLEPNDKEKTCQAIASFGNNQDGTWLQEDILMLDPRGPITLQTYSKLYIKDGRVCTRIHKDMYAQSQLRFRGGQILQAEVPEFYDEFERAVQPYLGKEACSYIEKKGALYHSQMKIEGDDRVFPTQRFKWIAPDAGYRLVPYRRGTQKHPGTRL